MGCQVVFKPSFSWGSLIPSVGYGRCWRCRKPWWCATPRGVEYEPGRGQFALCQPCWGRSEMHIRMAAHLHVSFAGRWTEDERYAIRQAVKRESKER